MSGNTGGDDSTNHGTNGGTDHGTSRGGNGGTNGSSDRDTDAQPPDEASLRVVPPPILGIHHVTVPVTDAQSAGDWYCQVFGFTTVLVEERENAVVLVQLEHPSGILLHLRQSPRRAAAMRGSNVFAMSVEDLAALRDWHSHLTDLGIRHGQLHPAHLGWALTIEGPDEQRVVLHTAEPLTGTD